MYKTRGQITCNNIGLFSNLILLKCNGSFPFCNIKEDNIALHKSENGDILYTAFHTAELNKIKKSSLFRCGFVSKSRINFVGKISCFNVALLK